VLIKLGRIFEEEVFINKKKGNFMKTLVDVSRTTQRYEGQQEHGEGHTDHPAVPMYTHEDIARRAYEIYLKRGRRQGQSQQDWNQAEQELQNERLATSRLQKPSLHAKMDSSRLDFERRSGQR
jgi:hypothetical protein